MPGRVSSVSPKGQVTLPREMRDHLGIKPKDRVEFELEGDVIKVRPARSRLMRHYGSVMPISRPEDFAALREAFEQGVADEVSAEDQG
ncbi:MAG: AbrB/MazE/SpoVT family DNA-binding domain-containing protein [Chloroflexi bacterium]|nr:AbrB/MazE/SpoVT family DNA-binding domain-containing protein [Chloroflexota bacterium]